MPPKVNDSHLHVGQFYNNYTSPMQVVEYADSVGIDHFAISSTTTCIGDYHRVLAEISEVVELAGDRVAPVLWVTPSLLLSDELENVVNSIKWRCVKIHPFLHKDCWAVDGDYMPQVLSICAQLNVPLLIHTGGCDCADAGAFEDVIKNNPHQIVILAHGRPIEQTIRLMSKYPNVWVDTAFMPMNDVAELIFQGFILRILWGSDYPIFSHYNKLIDTKEYYSELLVNISERMTSEQLKTVTHDNYLRIF